jgi:glutamate N-acetyltransferase/amino-acid N-acetyltransferase
MAIAVPQGYRLAGIYCGIKRNTSKLDLTLVVSDRPAVAAGVYTQNQVFAAPVALDRARTPATDVRAVVANSGNANACTGERGLADAEAMARAAAATCGADEKQALVLSTGIIGSFLPMDKILPGIQTAAAALDNSPAALEAAARGILTTDTTHKLSGRRITLGGRAVQITGMAKGAAMIGPNMATMLSLVLTDATLDPAVAQQTLAEIADETFNCIHVDGHMSTNDTVLLLANGASGAPRLSAGDAELAAFRDALREICTELARAIASDGEGATHLITLDVSGCRDRASARQIARTVADSPLVKTAIAGGDPNWGRIVSAAGYSGVQFDPARTSLRINGTLLYESGAPVEFDAAQVSASIRQERETHVDLRFAEGDGGVRFWTADLTAEYVRLNADYHT